MAKDMGTFFGNDPGWAKSLVLLDYTISKAGFFQSVTPLKEPIMAAANISAVSAIVSLIFYCPFLQSQPGSTGLVHEFKWNRLLNGHRSQRHQRCPALC